MACGTILGRMSDREWIRVLKCEKASGEEKGKMIMSGRLGSFFFFFSPLD